MRWTTSRRCLMANKTGWKQGHVLSRAKTVMLMVGCRGGVDDLLITLFSFCCSHVGGQK